ncbi:accessory factor UbiK family protein [Acetobacteraceae bacterium]|nr:accessory factor UbiK family protein [Acetobacteraceae bacterium]QCE34985.1 accessory factor UbiK family protein [Acetobacteraceae bacterium]
MDKTIMKSALLNDLAGFAGAAYSVANGVREEIKTVAKNQINGLSARMDLVPRSELDTVEILAQKTREETDTLKKQITDMQAHINELQERLTTLEDAITS